MENENSQIELGKTIATTEALQTEVTKLEEKVEATQSRQKWDQESISSLYERIAKLEEKLEANVSKESEPSSEQSKENPITEVIVPALPKEVTTSKTTKGILSWIVG